MESNTLTAIVILVVAFLAALYAYAWQKHISRSNDLLKEPDTQSVFSKTSIWQGIKFGLGFAIGVTIWSLILGALSLLFFGALLAAFTRALFGGV
jgi:ABC-type Fe3+ transport system permease subunit